jgi:hypothetical protein
MHTATIARRIRRALILITLIFGFIDRPAIADEFVAVVGSWHSRPEACHAAIARDCRDDVAGILYRADSGWTAGAMRNSLGRGSVLIGYTWRADIDADAGLAIELPILLASGYPAAPVIPMATPTLAKRWGRWTIRIGVLPPVRWQNMSPTAVIHFSVGWHI